MKFETNILSTVPLSEGQIDLITMDAKNKAEREIENTLGKEIDLSEYELQFEFVCRLTVIQPK